MLTKKVTKGRKGGGIFLNPSWWLATLVSIFDKNEATLLSISFYLKSQTQNLRRETADRHMVCVKFMCLEIGENLSFKYFAERLLTMESLKRVHNSYLEQYLNSEVGLFLAT